MRRCVVAVALLLWLHAGMDSALGYAESPKETMVAWYQTLMENSELPRGRLMDAMIAFYCEDLQDRFMPQAYKDATPDERARDEKARDRAADLHREWSVFLVTNDFTKANFEMAEEHTEEGKGTVIVRSDSNVVRSFRLVNEGRGWAISELPLPNQYAALVRILIIVAVAAAVLGIIAKKMIFS